MILIRNAKSFCFNFHFPKDGDENLKRRVEFIIKSNELLGEIIIKNETDLLLLKYRHKNNIYEHAKHGFFISNQVDRGLSL